MTFMLSFIGIWLLAIGLENAMEYFIDE